LSRGKDPGDGAGGSIGSEVVRTCLRFEPEMLFALDIDETELFVLEQTIKIGSGGLRPLWPIYGTGIRLVVSMRSAGRR